MTVQEPSPGAEKSCLNPPLGQGFSKIKQKTQNMRLKLQETVPNSNMFRNIVIHLKAQSFLVDVQNISNRSSFIYKPTQEIHDKQVLNYDFNKL